MPRNCCTEEPALWQTRRPRASDVTVLVAVLEADVEVNAVLDGVVVLLCEADEVAVVVRVVEPVTLCDVVGDWVTVTDADDVTVLESVLDADAESDVVAVDDNDDVADAVAVVVTLAVADDVPLVLALRVAEEVAVEDCVVILQVEKAPWTNASSAPFKWLMAVQSLTIRPPLKHWTLLAKLAAPLHSTTTADNFCDVEEQSFVDVRTIIGRKEVLAAHVVSMCVLGHASSKSLRAAACLPQSLMSEPAMDRKFVPSPTLQASFPNSDDVAVVLCEVVGDVVAVSEADVVPVLEADNVAEELCVLVWVVLGLVFVQP